MLTDEKIMKYALELAVKAKGNTTPNPMVGAVIVKDGEIVGQGYHEKAGNPHAEIHALREAGEKAQGATLYVTLEPCSHHGRTPPCVDAIISAGIKKVISAMEDPNPKVSGSGFEKLKTAGIEVEVGLLKKEAQKLNEVFVCCITTGLPYVTLKTAATLDGRVATYSGKSKWITNKEARIRVHEIRAQNDAIITGIGTVLADDPQLNVRYIETCKQPLRVVIDSDLRIPINAKILDDTSKTLIFTSLSADEKKMALLASMGIEIKMAGLIEGKLDLQEILTCLTEKNIASVLVEAGPKLVTSFLKSGKVDKWHHFIAPKLFGQDGYSYYTETGLELPQDAMKFSLSETEHIGEDLMLVLYPKRGEI